MSGRRLHLQYLPHLLLLSASLLHLPDSPFPLSRPFPRLPHSLRCHLNADQSVRCSDPHPPSPPFFSTCPPSSSSLSLLSSFLKKLAWLLAPLFKRLYFSLVKSPLGRKLPTFSHFLTLADARRLGLPPVPLDYWAPAGGGWCSHPGGNLTHLPTPTETLHPHKVMLMGLPEGFLNPLY